MSLRAIITALATTVTPSVGGVSPTVRYLESLTDSVEAADLPVRLIVPTASPGGVEGTDQHALSACGAGDETSAEWAIGDLLLVASVPLESIGANQAALVDYADAYVDALRAQRTLGGALVLGWGVAFGIYEWPTASGRWFYGALITVRLRELRT